MKRLSLCLLLVLTATCTPDGKDYSGYIEGEYVYIAPTTAGLLEKLNVERGQQVEKGEALFSLDETALEASRLSALADIEKAKANRESADKEYARVKALVATGAVSKSVSDAQKAAYESAMATVKASEQKLIQVEKQIAEAAPLSPAAGRIEDTYFRVGEFIAIGAPVVSLLPPENVKIRFFVPQAELPRFKLQTPVMVHCDGCSAPIPAKVSFIASKSEYTPPVIYSVGSRDKLVFMLEAKPDAFDPRLRPGLPVDVIMAVP